MNRQTVMYIDDTENSDKSENNSVKVPDYTRTTNSKLSGVTAISAIKYAAKKYNETNDGKFRALVQGMPQYDPELKIGEEQPARLELSRNERNKTETVLASKIAYPSDQDFNFEFEYQENDISDEKRKLEKWYTDYVSRLTE